MKIISITPFRYVLLLHMMRTKITANVTKKCYIQALKVGISLNKNVRAYFFVIEKEWVAKFEQGV